MAEYRIVPAARGLAWITDAFTALRRDPGAYLGASLTVGLLTSLPLVGTVLGILMPVFYAGLLSLLRTRAGGGSGSAGQAFDGFREPGAFARLLPIVSFNLAFALAAVTLLVVAAGPELGELLRAAEAGAEPKPEQAAALLAKIALPALSLLPIALYVGWMQMLAIPRAMLDGLAGGAALREAAGAVWANLGAFVFNLFGLLAVMFALVLVLAVPMMVVAAAQAAVPALGLLLQVALMALLAGSVLAIYAALMHQAVRDLFPETATPPALVSAIEA